MSFMTREISPQNPDSRARANFGPSAQNWRIGLRIFQAEGSALEFFAASYATSHPPHLPTLDKTKQSGSMSCMPSRGGTEVFEPVHIRFLHRCNLSSADVRQKAWDDSGDPNIFRVW